MVLFELWRACDICMFNDLRRKPLVKTVCRRFWLLCVDLTHSYNVLCMCGYNISNIDVIPMHTIPLDNSNIKKNCSDNKWWSRLQTLRFRSDNYTNLFTNGVYKEWFKIKYIIHTKKTYSCQLSVKYLSV